MITLYSYPQLFGLPDNNPFGLKVDTFLRLAQIPYKQEHILDTKNAPRGQLPYLIDNGEVITESNNIINYLSTQYEVAFDDALTLSQQQMHFLITRMLDNHLYWIMSYSRWQDDNVWPLFKAEFLKQVPQLTDEKLEQIKSYNKQKYQYQGVGKYTVNAIYEAGIADLLSIGNLLQNKPFLFGKQIKAIDACCYGFLANIFYFEIDTPLKKCINAHPHLKNYLGRIRERLGY